MIKSIKGLICDFDGTLVDSEPWFAKAWERTARAVGITTAIDFTVFIGATDEYTAEVLIRDHALPLTAKALLDIYRLEFTAVSGAIVPFSGVIDTLRVVTARGIAVAVTSNSTRSYVLRTAASSGVDAFVQCFVCSDDVERKKPSPDIYLKACARIGIPAAQCAAVEDSVDGIAAAKAAGLFCFALPTSFPRERLTSADKLLERFSDIEYAVGIKG